MKKMVALGWLILVLGAWAAFMTPEARALTGYLILAILAFYLTVWAVVELTQP